MHSHRPLKEEDSPDFQPEKTLLLVQVHEGLPDAKAHMEAIQPGSGSLAQAALHLEVAMVQQYYRQAAAAQSQLDQAAAVLGVSISVTGTQPSLACSMSLACVAMSGMCFTHCAFNFALY